MGIEDTFSHEEVEHETHLLGRAEALHDGDDMDDLPSCEILLRQRNGVLLPKGFHEISRKNHLDDKSFIHIGNHLYPLMKDKEDGSFFVTAIDGERLHIASSSNSPDYEVSENIRIWHELYSAKDN